MSGEERMELLEDAALLERARLSGRSVGEETALALETGVIPARYSVNVGPLSTEEQAKLNRSKVLLAGSGGLARHLLDHLARMGVGSITICAPEVTEPAGALAEVQNPLVAVDVINAPVQEPLLANAHIVADCLPGPDEHLALEWLANKAGLPLVAAGASGYSALVGSSFPGATGLGEFMSSALQGTDSGHGVFPPALSFAASLQAVEVVRILTRGEAPLNNSLLVADLWEMRFNTVSLNSTG